MNVFASNLRKWHPQFKQICIRCFSVSTSKNGLEEFFQPGVYEGNNYVDEDPIAGRQWKISELRIRSNSDLHKFWYVLLKEKNKLLTLDHECKRLGIPVPGPTCLNKVERAMKLVEIVVTEREKAISYVEKQRKYKFDVENSEDTSTTHKKANEFEQRDLDEELSDSIENQVKL